MKRIGTVRLAEALMEDYDGGSEMTLTGVVLGGCAGLLGGERVARSLPERFPLILFVPHLSPLAMLGWTRKVDLNVPFMVGRGARNALSTFWGHCLVERIESPLLEVTRGEVDPDFGRPLFRVVADALLPHDGGLLSNDTIPCLDDGVGRWIKMAMSFGATIDFPVLVPLGWVDALFLGTPALNAVDASRGEGLGGVRRVHFFHILVNHLPGLFWEVLRSLGDGRRDEEMMGLIVCADRGRVDDVDEDDLELVVDDGMIRCEGLGLMDSLLIRWGVDRILSVWLDGERAEDGEFMMGRGVIIKAFARSFVRIALEQCLEWSETLHDFMEMSQRHPRLFEALVEEGAFSTIIRRKLLAESSPIWTRFVRLFSHGQHPDPCLALQALQTSQRHLFKVFGGFTALFSAASPTLPWLPYVTDQDFLTAYPVSRSPLNRSRHPHILPYEILETSLGLIHECLIHSDTLNLVVPDRWVRDSPRCCVEVRWGPDQPFQTLTDLSVLDYAVLVGLEETVLSHIVSVSESLYGDYRADVFARWVERRCESCPVLSPITWTGQGGALDPHSIAATTFMKLFLGRVSWHPFSDETFGRLAGVAAPDLPRRLFVRDWITVPTLMGMVRTGFFGSVNEGTMTDAPPVLCVAGWRRCWEAVGALVGMPELDFGVRVGGVNAVGFLRACIEDGGGDVAAAQLLWVIVRHPSGTGRRALREVLGIWEGVEGLSEVLAEVLEGGEGEERTEQLGGSDGNGEGGLTDVAMMNLDDDREMKKPEQGLTLIDEGSAALTGEDENGMLASPPVSVALSSLTVEPSSLQSKATVEHQHHHDDQSLSRQVELSAATTVTTTPTAAGIVKKRERDGSDDAGVGKRGRVGDVGVGVEWGISSSYASSDSSTAARGGVVGGAQKTTASAPRKTDKSIAASAKTKTDEKSITTTAPASCKMSRNPSPSSSSFAAKDIKGGGDSWRPADGAGGQRRREFSPDMGKRRGEGRVDERHGDNNVRTNAEKKPGHGSLESETGKKSTVSRDSRGSSRNASPPSSSFGARDSMAGGDSWRPSDAGRRQVSSPNLTRRVSGGDVERRHGNETIVRNEAVKTEKKPIATNTSRDSSSQQSRFDTTKSEKIETRKTTITTRNSGDPSSRNPSPPSTPSARDKQRRGDYWKASEGGRRSASSRDSSLTRRGEGRRSLSPPGRRGRRSPSPRTRKRNSVDTSERVGRRKSASPSSRNRTGAEASTRGSRRSSPSPSSRRKASPGASTRGSRRASPSPLSRRQLSPNASNRGSRRVSPDVGRSLGGGRRVSPSSTTRRDASPSVGASRSMTRRRGSNSLSRISNRLGSPVLGREGLRRSPSITRRLGSPIRGGGERGRSPSPSSARAGRRRSLSPSADRKLTKGEMEGRRRSPLPSSGSRGLGVKRRSPSPGGIIKRLGSPVTGRVGRGRSPSPSAGRKTTSVGRDEGAGIASEASMSSTTVGNDVGRVDGSLKDLVTGSDSSAPTVSGSTSTSDVEGRVNGRQRTSSAPTPVPPPLPSTTTTVITGMGEGTSLHVTRAAVRKGGSPGSDEEKQTKMPSLVDDNIVVVRRVGSPPSPPSPVLVKPIVRAIPIAVQERSVSVSPPNVTSAKILTTATTTTAVTPKALDPPTVTTPRGSMISLLAGKIEAQRRLQQTSSSASSTGTSFTVNIVDTGRKGSENAKTLSEQFRGAGIASVGPSLSSDSGGAVFKVSFGEGVGRRVEAAPVESGGGRGRVENEISTRVETSSDGVPKFLVPRDSGTVISFSNVDKRPLPPPATSISPSGDDGNETSRKRLKAEHNEWETGGAERVVLRSGEEFRISIQRGASTVATGVSAGVATGEVGVGGKGSVLGRVGRPARVVDRELLTMELFEACLKGKAQIIHNILDNEWPYTDDGTSAPFSKTKGSLLLAWVSSLEVNLNDLSSVAVVKKIIEKFNFSWKVWSQDTYQTALSILIYRDAVTSFRDGRRSIEPSETTLVVLRHAGDRRLKTPWIYPATVVTFARNVKILSDDVEIVSEYDQKRSGHDAYALVTTDGVPVSAFVEILRCFHDRCYYDLNAKHHTLKEGGAGMSVGEVLEWRREGGGKREGFGWVPSLSVSRETWEALKDMLVQAGVNFRGRGRD
ncbi:hypothetical protein HDU67_003659 [Dinochytrium kinnereticum]|nr:hypothetical protein HDU67_003659 [Dinochytrium kinnereticum]